MMVPSLLARSQTRRSAFPKVCDRATVAETARHSVAMTDTDVQDDDGPQLNTPLRPSQQAREN
jgi:hypothetical protein